MFLTLITEKDSKATFVMKFAKEARQLAISQQDRLNKMKNYNRTSIAMVLDESLLNNFEEEAFATSYIKQDFSKAWSQ